MSGTREPFSQWTHAFAWAALGKADPHLDIAILSLCTGCLVRSLWVATHVNPADDPSRSVPLRRPTAVLEWASRLVSPQVADHQLGSSSSSACGASSMGRRAFRARECYGGHGCLTCALNKKRVQCQSYEAYQKGEYIHGFDIESDAVVEEEIRAARAGEIDYAHFGIVCSSWSTLNKINGGSRTRINARGNEVLERDPWQQAARPDV